MIEKFNSFRKQLETKLYKDNKGHEVCSGQDLRIILEYSELTSFEKIVDKAKVTCQQSGMNIDSNFVITKKNLENASLSIDDYEFSRYACYLIAQNADSEKKIVAIAQSNFAMQTRSQEIEDLVGRVSKNEKRIHLRHDIKKQNGILSGVVKGAGVTEPLDYAIFYNEGYKGLYDGRTARDIAKHKGLSEKDNILDRMGSEELAANIFRITQTAAKIEREKIKGKQQANKTHFEIAQKIRQTIQEIGGTMPEELPTEQSIKQLTKQHKKEVKQFQKNKTKQTKRQLKPRQLIKA